MNVQSVVTKKLKNKDKKKTSSNNVNGILGLQCSNMQWALYICLHTCLSIYVYIFMLWHKIVFISVLEYSLNNHLWCLWQAVDAGFFFFCEHPDRELFQEDGSVNRVRLWCDTHLVLSFACQKTDKLERLGTAREFSGCHHRSAWTLFCTSKQARLIKYHSVWEIKEK